jgi:hypothetical protein
LAIEYQSVAGGIDPVPPNHPSRRKNLNKSQTTAPNTTARKHPVKTPTAGMFNRADTP